MKVRILISLLNLVILHLTAYGILYEHNEILNEPVNQDMVFIPNKGQWDDDVKFLTKTGGMNAWITNQGVVFDFYRIDREIDRFEKLNKFRNIKMFDEREKVRHYGHVVNMNLNNSRETEPVIRTLDKKTTHYHYFIGNDSNRWVNFVPSYGEVIIEQLQPSSSRKLRQS